MFLLYKTCAKLSSDDADVVKDEEESGAETNAHEKTPATPKRSAKRQKTTKGGVSKRVSPRKPNKTDYKKLADPSNSEDNAEEEDAEEEDAKDEDAEDEDGSNVSGYEDEDKASDDASEAGSEASSSGTSWEGPDRSKVSYYYMGPNVSDSEEEAA